MNIPYIRAPHVEGAPSSGVPAGAPNAALLIDFDNVTMGMRSDLSRELKSLLKSDVIRGKVTVQRAYADWRRYPQYIVPLSEASVDLIFAPAYGSSKKNATDIRMAIDGMELVFTRPEIGTFILLTGDSDFSSLVLKLKEYGKYVIGVGIQESSSDILVQNCDEYYSYTSLSGLRKAGTGEQGSHQDPWSLVERAVEQMVRRRDVMRSDRLKQVMLELDASFDEKSMGFSKFSRFLNEAAQKGLIQLTKLENGQHEISAGRGAARASAERPARSSSRDARSRNDRSPREAPKTEPKVVAEEAQPLESTTAAEAQTAPASQTPASQAPAEVKTSPPSGETPLQDAYALLIRSIEALSDGNGEAGARDSDVKRRMLAFQQDFDEGTLGFSKFSQFLREAESAGVVSLNRDEQGVYTVRAESLPDAAASDDPPPSQRPSVQASETPKAESSVSPTDDGDARRLRPRLSSRRRGAEDEVPPLLEGQVVEAPGPAPKEKDKRQERDAGKTTEADQPSSERAAKTQGRKRSGGRTKAETPRSEKSRSEKPAPTPSGVSAEFVRLGLPQDRDEIGRYLTSAYRGVGMKTVERLLDAHGDRLLDVMDKDPDAIRSLLPAARAELLLEQWVDDVAKRRAEAAGPDGRTAATKKETPARRRNSGGGRRRGGSGRSTRS